MSYIRLYLDTTPPEIEIINPKYTTKNIINVITISSNEEMSDYQNIYIIDSNNVRYDYIFQRSSAKSLYGEVSFADFSTGIATIYAELEDDVGNRSNLMHSTIDVKESIPMLRITSSVANMSIKETRCVTPMKISSREMKRHLHIDN